MNEYEKCDYLYFSIIICETWAFTTSPNKQNLGFNFGFICSSVIKCYQGVIPIVKNVH